MNADRSSVVIERIAAHVVPIGVTDVDLYEAADGTQFVKLADVRRAERENADADLSIIRQYWRPASAL